jgi:hypothetical protein
MLKRLRARGMVAGPRGPREADAASQDFGVDVGRSITDWRVRIVEVLFVRVVVGKSKSIE